MVSYFRRRLAMMDVVQTPSFVVIRGISKFSVIADINRRWETSKVAKYCLMASNSSEIKIQNFFLPDLLYMVRELVKEPRTATAKRTYIRLIELLLEKTWVGQAENWDGKSVINERTLGSLSPWPLKDYQRAAIVQYGKIVPAYGLKGYLLDAGTGSGKTMTCIEWAESLGMSKVIVICPPNVVDNVWKTHLTDVIKRPKKVWTSTSGDALSLDYDYYVTHYQQTANLLEFVSRNVKAFNKAVLILDESHNLNKITSDRTINTLDIHKTIDIRHTMLASATAIGAIGVECIPFMRIADPYFTDNVEERFRKIYGRSAKRANEILQNRLGIMKYHIPKQDLPEVTMTHHEIKVTIPDGGRFTLNKISDKLREYMDQRVKYYEANRARFHETYEQCLKIHEGKLGVREVRDFNTYRSYIDVIRRGYDPVEHKEMSMYCNQYERKQIIPSLPEKMRQDFRDSKSVVKYLKLKVMGEALGLLGRYRSECNLAMVEHLNMAELIDGASKKTLIFTSYIDVVEAAASKLISEGYSPVVIYGANTKDIPALLKKFRDDPDANPLITTFQSLSTGVPITSANRTIYLNYPFRDAIKTQADGRTARLGQDSPCDYYGVLLDTGAEPNVSTRNLDIMAWSAEQVGMIMGVKNLDEDSLSMEQEDVVVNESAVELDDLSMELLIVVPANKQEMPTTLYHGSMYSQSEIMPGYKRSGKLVMWDKYESNKWLYATSSRMEAILLGIGSALEKTHDTERYQYDLDTLTITITGAKGLSRKDVEALTVYLYSIGVEEDDRWHKNINHHNSITTEYKTEATIKDNLLLKEKIRLDTFLAGWSIHVE